VLKNHIDFIYCWPPSRLFYQNIRCSSDQTNMQALMSNLCLPDKSPTCTTPNTLPDSISPTSATGGVNLGVEEPNRTEPNPNQIVTITGTTKPNRHNHSVRNSLHSSRWLLSPSPLKGQMEGDQVRTERPRTAKRGDGHVDGESVFMLNGH